MNISKGAAVPESPRREHSTVISAFLFGVQSYQYVSFTIWTGCQSFRSPFKNSQLISNDLTEVMFQKQHISQVTIREMKYITCDMQELGI